MSAPGYMPALRGLFPQKTEAEIELLCSSSRQMQIRTGLDAHEHRKRGMSLLFPSRVWHEWRDQRMKSIQECISTRTKELAWVGSSNSNKTADMADSAIALWLTKPEMTSIYIASPYEKATEDGVWAELIMQFDEAKRNNPSLPGKHRLSDNSIILYDRNPRSFIKVTTVDQVGKLVGKKSRDFQQGLLVIYIDEFPAFQETAARKFLSVTKNLWSVPNLLIVAAGNFAWTGDGLGIFCDPDEEDIPGGYDGFDPDRHFRWRTKRGGICLRFDGLQSPNVKAGRDIYPFLTTNEYIMRLASQPGGLESPDAMRYIRSAPCTNLDLYTITNGERIRAGGALDPFTWTSDPIVKIAFIDPGWGGDDCLVQKFMLGWEQLREGGRRQVLALWEEPYIVPIKMGRKGLDGKPIPVEDQIVEGCKEHCRAKGVPETHIAFDGSMRAGIVQKFGANWSLKIQAVDSSGPPSDRKVNAGDNATWKDSVDRLLSELWFATASLIDSFQLKNLQLSTRGIEQLKARRWKPQGKHKKRVETKEEYKIEMKNQGKTVRSPGEADCIVGGVGIARRLGLTLEGVAINGGSMALLKEMLQERELHKRRQAVPGLADKDELPRGRLHAMKRQSSTNNGRLHRQVL